ncbi:MAG: AbrB/MazE/SpoVT family DNA-binding domain-containing protein [Candidatus Hodarchaeales archaeon]|jgi:antitoxin component of MazEF toxin-antitoxin module
MAKIFEQRSKTGSSWLVALPKDLFRAKGIRVGDTIEFILVNGDIVIQKVEK